MNQAIQFPEREWWDDDLDAVCFPALVYGMQCICAISKESLANRYGLNVDSLVAFRINRWELEEEAQRCIEQEEGDSQGWYWLSASR